MAEYKIVKDGDYSWIAKKYPTPPETVKNLEGAVEFLMSKGWELQGGVAVIYVGNTVRLQAMTYNKHNYPIVYARLSDKP